MSNGNQKINFNLILKQKKRNDKISLIFLRFVFTFFILLFLSIIVFMFIKAYPGVKAYGVKNIFFSNHFNLANTNDGTSVWLPLSITVLTSILAVLIAAPIGIKTATFIKFRIKNERLQKIIKILILSLSGIPSVIFGLFTLRSLGPSLNIVFHLGSGTNLVSSIFMLAFIILPTIIALVLNTYDGIDMRLIENGIGLGNSYTKAIYKIFMKEARGGIIIAVIIAFGRAIGETMAVSMILSSELYNNVFVSTFNEFFGSSLRPLGAVIARNIFSENGGEALKGVLYIFGIFLLVFIMFLNGIVSYLSSHKGRMKKQGYKKFEHFISRFFSFIPRKLSILFERLNYRPKINLHQEKNVNIHEYIKDRIHHQKLGFVFDWYKLILEILMFSIAFSFLSWISLDIIINGAIALNKPSSTAFVYGKDTTLQASTNTFIIIIISLLISFPIALFVAIYINEYQKNNWWKKTVMFFLDAFGSTPTIIFGMYGLSVFIQLFGFTSAGTIGKSLIAGCLTISLVILPTFTRSIIESLNKVPLTVRENAFGLGLNKWGTITKLVLPAAMKGIMSNTILAIGRIISETAPIYLTAGLSSAAETNLLYPGQTLTTRIYAQLTENNTALANDIMYESAIISLILVITIITILNYVIPLISWFKKIVLKKMSMKEHYQKQENSVKVNWLKFTKQILDNKLYLTYEQANLLAIDTNKYKITKIKNKFYKVKYIEEKQLEELLDCYGKRYQSLWSQ
ncbi:phosphate ABC transporter permease [Ureaplasma canigenitalium]|uniref:phosphate ABC transporter permease n=1 Tax=Ureaplasma canigenitalium TaxID=42092 RepID=UPI0006893CC0|nr:ABC transporter permease subunit [Ureaplasma canigenitalium]